VTAGTFLLQTSPFVEHRLPAAGSFVTLPDGSLGKLGAIPRGLIVATTPRDLPENAPLYPPSTSLRHKGKHPAELPGMVDVRVLQQHGLVVWPALELSVPVCAVAAADSARLRDWHVAWDAHLGERREAAAQLAETIEGLLAKGAHPDGALGPKAVVSELTAVYSTLEEAQRELDELEPDAPAGVDAERMASLQKGIQRFAALARFG